MRRYTYKLRRAAYYVSPFGRFVFTPHTPPTAPAAASSSSLFIPAGSPTVTSPAAVSPAYSAAPHAIPPRSPYLRRYLPSTYPDAKPPTATEKAAKLPINCVLPSTNRDSADSIAAETSIAPPPQSSAAPRLSIGYAQRLCLCCRIKMPPHRISIRFYAEAVPFIPRPFSFWTSFLFRQRSLRKQVPSFSWEQQP